MYVRDIMGELETKEEFVPPLPNTPKQWRIAG
jgi:hypothetical protein